MNSKSTASKARPRINSWVASSLAAVMLGFAFLVLREHIQQWLPPEQARPLILALLGVVVTVIGAMAIACWRALDELAREAHKAAWFWGGTAGLSLAIVAASPTITSAIPAASFVASATPSAAFGLGAIAAGLAAIVGYILAWAAFWLLKR